MIKRFAYLLVAVLALSACSTDLGDIEDRIKKVEEQGKDLESKHNQLVSESDRLKQESATLSEEVKKRQEENEKIRQQLQDFEASVSDPKLISLEFIAADNPLQLIDNVKCDIIGDSVAECRILNITSSKELIPRFTFQGSVVTINGVEVKSGDTKIDFSRPVVLSVITAKKIKDYTVYVNAYTRLPTVWLETSDHKDVTKAEQYYNGKIKVTGNLTTSAKSLITHGNVKFMALGKLLWYKSRIHSDEQLGKNTFSLLFDRDFSLLDSPEGNTWKLYTNAADKTMLHNRMGYYLGEISSLDYTPRFHHVNLMLNGRYFGTYLLGEEIEASEGRVDVGADGFVLGVGSTASGPTFKTTYLENAVGIVAPSASQSAEAVNYVSDYVTRAENALFSLSYTDAEQGWQQYLDIDSFVDWYLVNEIAKNENATFKRDCMMNLKRGGKLKMGPLWDFESAFGTGSGSTGFVVKNVLWYARLFQDPAFVSRVKQRYNYYYSHKYDIINEINTTAQYLKYAIQEDNNKWETFTDTPNSGEEAWSLYQKSVYDMEVWLSDRMDWLKGQFDAMA